MVFSWNGVHDAPLNVFALGGVGSRLQCGQVLVQHPTTEYNDECGKRCAHGGVLLIEPTKPEGPSAQKCCFMQFFVYFGGF